QYPAPACAFQPITNAQIKRAIARLQPYKAAGTDEVQNVVFKKCQDILVPFMGALFRATFTLHRYPQDWKDSRTVVL
ncbi:hypothetical protein FA95DRAFT_1473040, partial [Auriscalpium vulgare]